MRIGSSVNSIGERVLEKGSAAWGHAAYSDNTHSALGTQFETWVASLASYSAVTPLGLTAFSAHLPRVARSSQPWALMRNPVGIGKMGVTCRVLLCTLFLVTVTLVVGQPVTAPSVQLQAPTDSPATGSDLRPPTQPAGYLAWEADSKEFDAKPGDLAARFTFYVTNVSAEVVIITNLQRTCGCTEASMAAQPWSIAPGDSGPIRATIDLRGKIGRISKQLTVNSTAGAKALTLNVNIPAAANPQSGSKMDRALNQQIAARDRQAVFKGDCAKCHAEPTIGKLGHELYKAGCAICHEAENRAAMVPDLHGVNHPTDAEQLRQWITSSKPGSMMPAFAKDFDGPLSDEQISSLVDYLGRTN